ncbi:MAG: hypothetical protein EBU31_04315, partial [Proteobacteria bacterium]|nr:hypothetical protein [Pseudomonadota bacterium]
MQSNSTPSQTSSRLARHLAAAAAAAITGASSAEIIYHQYNLVLPANIDGIYVNVETFQTGTAASATPGWDLNPYSQTGTTSLSFFSPTGGGLLRYPGSATTTVAGNLAANTPIDGLGSYSASTTAVTFGAAAGNWVLNSVNLCGFKFVAADGLTHYGWARIQVGASTGVRTLVDVGYESVANVAIAAGAQGGPPPAYDPCSPSNPIAAIGTNLLGLNQATAADLNLAGSGCGFVAYKANYFKFVAPAAGTYTIDTCASGAATRIAVLNGCTGGSTILACDDNTCAPSSRVTLTAAAQQTYYIVIGGDTAATALPSPINLAVTPPPTAACTDAPAAVFGNNPFNNVISSLTQVVSVGAAGTRRLHLQHVRVGRRHQARHRRDLPGQRPDLHHVRLQRRLVRVHVGLRHRRHRRVLQRAQPHELRHPAHAGTHRRPTLPPGPRQLQRHLQRRQRHAGHRRPAAA